MKWFLFYPSDWQLPPHLRGGSLQQRTDYIEGLIATHRRATGSA